MMGLYYRAVCHTCRTVYFPALRKLGEIRINESVAADLGRWLCRHAGGDYTGEPHEVALLGDLCDEALAACNDYRIETIGQEDRK